MATKKYESMRIMSLEGSVVFKNDGFTATKDGKPDPKAFRGVLDESLDTLKLAEVYDRHKSELAYPYLDGKKRFCRAVVSLSFNRAIKLYESYGNRYILNSYNVTDAEMLDHVCISTVGGKPTLIAIDVSFRENSGYTPVEEPIAEGILGKYFKYDADTRSYKRSDKTIPTDISCREIREHLYTRGFDIDGVHYVRYKRSAGASRDGRCLFIAEPLYADMMAWSSCDLSADIASDQASWQAYIALTLSSIESTIRLPKKSILIIRDRVSRFTENVICVKETDTHDLRAEEEETEIENVIWDGEALLDAEIFNVNGYGTRGMMLLRNRFFKTCAFNTNLQDWFFDNDITQVSRLAGYTTARDIKDIKLVITESSVKYFKFMPKDMPFEQKCKRFLDALYEGKNSSVFGVVKADHDAPLMDGMMAYTNYQLLNTIGLTREGVGKLLELSFEYLQDIIPVLGEIKLDKLTQNDLQNFYTHLKTTGRLQYTEQQGNGLSDRMVRGCHASCRMALEKAVKEGLITMNPAIGCKLPPKKAREMQVLTHDEMQRFLIQAKYDGYYEIFLLDLSTGLRRGELMGLQWKDLNFTTGELRVERQVSRVNGELKTFPPKTKSSIRTVVLPPSVLKMLKAYQPSTNGSKWIFPSPVKTDDSPRDPHTVYSKMQLVLERAECKRIRFHDLRHTFATMALEHGMDVKTLSAMIGHVSSATTLDVYSHITTEMQISAAQKIDKGIGKVDTAIREDAVPTPKKRERTMTDFKPKQGKIRKSGTGGIYQISENLWEGRFTPTNAQGKREAHNVYAKTKEECERLLDEMIVEVRQQIQAEKEQMKDMSL